MSKHLSLSSRREFLTVGVAGSAAAMLPSKRMQPVSDDPVSIDPIAELIKLEVKLVEWVRENARQVLEAPISESRQNWLWVDYGFRWPAFTLVHLFTTRHPANPLYQAEWCLDLALDLIDKEVAYWIRDRDLGRPISTGETPHYVAAYVLESVPDRIDEKRRESWLEHEAAWVAQALRRPLGITGGYHDSWRMTALYRLGKVLRHPEWSEMGIYLFKRLLSRQTKEGFWEDGRHHGPSPRYCGLMLPSLAWMYRWTEDEAFLNAARKLAGFMATFVYPDAVTVGAFDGRNSNVLAYFPICPGFELSDRGRAYSARAFRLWQELGMLEDISRAAQSTRDLPRLAFYSADTCLYLSQYAPEPDNVLANELLPIERRGALENHSTEFDGVMLRKGPWILALSGQNSGVRGRYRLERESRIELWHEKAGLICGGGHHRQDWKIPHANAVLDTGHSGRTQFGAPAEAGMEVVPAPYFKTRLATSRLLTDAGELRLVFGHGIISFRIVLPSAEKAVIQARWETRFTDRLCLQLPLVVWFGGEVFLDGVKQQAEKYQPRSVEREIRVQGLRNNHFNLRLPEGVSSSVHFPIKTGVFHGGSEKHRKVSTIESPFDILLVSCQWAPPPAQGAAEFTVTL